MRFVPPRTRDGKSKSYLDFWKTKPGNEGKPIKKFYVQSSYDSPSILSPGSCVVKEGRETLDTSTSKHYMQALVNANSDVGFCYAFSFNPIDLKYNYGDGPCEVSVSDHFNKEIESDNFVLSGSNNILSIPI